MQFMHQINNYRHLRLRQLFDSTTAEVPSLIFFYKNNQQDATV